jgi:MFS family permease
VATARREEKISSTEALAGSWGSLFRGGSAIYSLMVMLGVVLFSLQILIVVTIMPTVVADIGGAAYYVWASMLYQVGAIVGAAVIGSIWRVIGMRGGFMVTATIYTVGTLGCALAPDMLTLNLSRFVQGLGGGLVTGGTMALIGRVFLPQQRTRMLAIYQGVWTICSLLGPFFGGAFAAAGWWRGAFWASLPFAILFGIIAWLKVPGDRGENEQRARIAVPGLRLALLTLGVAGIAEAGQLRHPLALAILLLASLTMMALTFRIDAGAEQRLFPTLPLSLSSPVGLGYWVLIIGGGTQAAITILLPLSLQIVHGLSPLWVGLANLVISIAWTIATFLVSGWSGARERFALNSGVALMLVSLLLLLPTAQGERLPLLLLAVFIFGWGIGSHNVHLGARTMGAALKGEEAITAASQSMVRSLGGAVGTAAAGIVANLAGLGEQITIKTVNGATLAIYLAAIVPLALGVFFILRFTRLVVPRPA